MTDDSSNRQGVVIKSPGGELVSSSTLGHNTATWGAKVTASAVFCPHIQEGHLRIAFELTKGFQRRESSLQKKTGPCRDAPPLCASAASVCVCARACVSASPPQDMD